MTTLLVLFALASPADHRINAVIGDASWIATHGAAPADSTDEVTRIRTHLSYVIEILRARRVAAHQLERNAALAALADYEQRGVFPRRTDDTYAGRRPRFIDDRGVRCAVGELIWTSGDPALARAITADYEYAYVRDMHSPALAAWADAHGFTIDELAMIQPGYSEPPSEGSTRSEIAGAKDSITLECAKAGPPPPKLAIHVFGLDSGRVRVGTTSTTPFARCFVMHASASAQSGGAWAHRPHVFDYDMTVSLPTLQHLLDYQLAYVRDLYDCAPRPGALARTATVDVASDAHGLAVHVATTPSNDEVDRCVEDAVRNQLAAFSAGGAWQLRTHGAIALHSPFEPLRVRQDLQGAASMHATECYTPSAPAHVKVSITAHVDDAKLAITVDASDAAFATCVADKVQATLHRELGVSRKLDTGAYERYFRIDRDVDVAVDVPVETPQARDARQKQQRKQFEEQNLHVE